MKIKRLFTGAVPTAHNGEVPMRSGKRNIPTALALLAGLLVSSHAGAQVTAMQEYFCAADVSSVGTCKANEVSLSAVTDIGVTDVDDNPLASCVEGQLIKLSQFDATLNSNTGTRYDVTFWTGRYGNDPRADNGDDPTACAVTSLPDTPSSPYIADFEGITPADHCLDFTKPPTPQVVSFGGQGSVFTCNDTDNNGIADIQVLTTWNQNVGFSCGTANQTPPLDINDPVFSPGAPSKCDYNIIDLVPILGKLTVRKETTGGTGSFGFTSDVAGNANFSIDTSATNPNSHVIEQVAHGTYQVHEVAQSGWTLALPVCTYDDGGGLAGIPEPTGATAIDMTRGQAVTCNFTNAMDGTLTIIKQTIGGADTFNFPSTLNTTDVTFQLSAAPGSPGNKAYPMAVGDVLIVNEDEKAGWVSIAPVCEGNATFTVGTGGPRSVEITSTGAGQGGTCTYVNVKQPTLELVKVVVNNNGGTADAANWNLSATGPTPISGDGGVGPTIVGIGTYDLSETGGPAGYTASDWSCVGGTQSDADTVVLGAGQNVVCTITNDDDGPTLELRKQVVNDDGGTALPVSWTLSAAGPTPLSGAGGVTPTPVNAGTYTLSESAGPAGYTAGDWSCTDGTLTGSSLVLTLADSAVCTIVNDDDAANLTLVKTVTNDNGGTASATDWTLSAAGPTPLSGKTGTAAVTAVPVDAGVYSLSESAGPTGYTAGSWSCTEGTLSGSRLTLTNGVSATCTINNNDNVPVIPAKDIPVNDKMALLLLSLMLLIAGWYFRPTIMRKF